MVSGWGYWNGTNWIATAGEYSAMHLVSGIVSFYTNSGLTASSSFSPTERMRIDGSGNLLHGCTGTTGSAISDGGIRMNKLKSLYYFRTNAARNAENVNTKVQRIKLDDAECIACEG